MGVLVVLRFHEINDGNAKVENCEIIKVLHLDINKGDPLEHKHWLESLYSSSAINFPLGIKMRLIRDFKLLTNIKAKEKAHSLHATQGQFLQQTETCITWEIATIDLEDKTLHNSLHYILMNIPDPENFGQKLFHLVNQMFNKNGSILRFHPTCSQNAQDIVAGLCVYIKGLWQGLIDEQKFNKFFTDTALDRAKDAWWDPQQRCVITQADEEMTAILKTDSDIYSLTRKLSLTCPEIWLLRQTLNNTIVT